MPWPPTGAFDPVIDIGDQVASTSAPGVEAESDLGASGISFDPSSNMIALGLTSAAEPAFDLFPAPDEPRFAPVDVDKKRQAVIDFAKTKLGIDYVWGGTTDKGYDCSGLVLKAFSSVGIVLPRVSQAQAQAGSRVKISDLQPGDLVAWDHPGGQTGFDHIAIYLGNGKIIEAPHTGAKVRIRSLGKNEGAVGVHLNY